MNVFTSSIPRAHWVIPDDNEIVAYTKAIYGAQFPVLFYGIFDHWVYWYCVQEYARYNCLVIETLMGLKIWTGETHMGTRIRHWSFIFDTHIKTLQIYEYYMVLM